MLNSMHPRTWEYVSFDWKSGELTSKMELHIHIIQYSMFIQLTKEQKDMFGEDIYTAHR